MFLSHSVKWNLKCEHPCYFMICFLYIIFSWIVQSDFSHLTVFIFFVFVFACLNDLLEHFVYIINLSWFLASVCKLSQQQSDETPMVWEMLLYLYVLYSQDWHYRSTMPIFFFLYGIVFAVVHSQVHLGMAFKVHYAALCLLCIPRMYKYYVYTKDIAAKRIAQMYLGTLCFGGLLWLFDRMFCSKISLWYINPQGHACWHILMGFNSYFENTFLMFCRAQQLEWQPQVAYIFGFFPYVKIQKLKHQWQGRWFDHCILWKFITDHHLHVGVPWLQNFGLIGFWTYLCFSFIYWNVWLVHLKDVFFIC